MSIKKIFYFITLVSGLAYNTGFSQKGNLFGKDFDSERRDYVEMFRKKIINNEIGENFDTTIQIKKEFIFRFQKKGNDYIYYITEHGYLHYFCEKKDNIVRCLYGLTSEIKFKLNKKNVIKWFQFSSNNLVFQFTLSWDGEFYKIRKCTGCQSVLEYERNINESLKLYQQNIVFIGIENKESK